MAETHGKIKFILLIAAAIIAAAVCRAAIVAFPDDYARETKLAAAEFGVDDALIRAVILAESGYDENAVSAAGASGLMQLMPGTREMMSAATGIAADGSAGSEIRLGTAYLARLLKMFGSEEDALAAYNAGPSNVMKWKAGDGQPFPETSVYVKRVAAYRRIYARVFAF